MADILLGGKTYPGIDKVRLDTPEGDTVDFTPYEETFAAGKAEGYENGKTDGIAEGYSSGKTDGIAEGIQTEYDRFWSEYQKKGNQSTWLYSYAGFGWNEKTFRPKYRMSINGVAKSTFYANQAKIDLTEYAREHGIDFTFKLATGSEKTFDESCFTHIPVVDISEAEGGVFRLFHWCLYLHTIDKFIVSETVTSYDYNFRRNDVLANILIEGVIAANIDFSYSPLTAASITSVITHLSDSAAGKTVTFKLSAVNSAFETAEGAADGSTSEAWAALIATKSNWTISCV